MASGITIKSYTIDAFHRYQKFNFRIGTGLDPLYGSTIGEPDFTGVNAHDAAVMTLLLDIPDLYTVVLHGDTVTVVKMPGVEWDVIDDAVVKVLERIVADPECAPIDCMHSQIDRRFCSAND